MGPRAVLVHGDHHLATRLHAALSDAGLPPVTHLTSPVELEEAIAALAPDVLITTMTLEGRDIMPAISQAVRRLPGLRVIVLTAWADRASARVALAAGACGVLITGDDAEALCRKILLLATSSATLVETSVRGGPPGDAAPPDRPSGGDKASALRRRPKAGDRRNAAAVAASAAAPRDLPD